MKKILLFSLLMVFTTPCWASLYSQCSVPGGTQFFNANCYSNMCVYLVAGGNLYSGNLTISGNMTLR